MRDAIDAGRVRAFLTALGERLNHPTVVYLTGGATAVLEGWRATTIDLDLKLEPDVEALSLLPRLKEELRINVELASPDHFLPPVPGWKSRSPYVTTAGKLEVRHFDLYSQALAKIERGFERDLRDVRAMIERGLVDREKLAQSAQEIVPELPRYPAIDRDSFLRSLGEFLASLDAD